MKRARLTASQMLAFLLLFSFPSVSNAWHDETHLAIAKAAGYQKWYNAAGADIAKVKAGDKEGYNHYTNNPPDTVVTPKMILDQVAKYNDPTDEKGHLYGAIIASLRDYRSAKATGKYGECHLAYCAHYVGDLSMPLHNTLYDSFNRQHHNAMDGIVNDEVLDHLERIRIYPIQLKSEEDLVREIARIANLSMKLGYQFEAEKPDADQRGSLCAARAQCVVAEGCFGVCEVSDSLFHLAQSNKTFYRISKGELNNGI